MFKPRLTYSVAGVDDVKVYAISASGVPIDIKAFLPQLHKMKATVSVVWSTTAAFAIFHESAAAPYLVLCWWGNDNELFVRVAVRESHGWTVRPERYSFCLWDMEVMWLERQSYIRRMYSGEPSLEAYRADIATLAPGGE